MYIYIIYIQYIYTYIYIYIYNIYNICSGRSGNLLKVLCTFNLRHVSRRSLALSCKYVKLQG